MALWNGVGQVASIAQLTGVDAYGLISMIVEAAQTVKRNRETCQLLARRTKMIGDLLQQLQSTQLMQHTETRIPVEQLEETLRHTYLLITSCREGSYLHSCFMGGRQADQLREVQNEITFYLQLFPLVSFVDTTRTWERILNRDRPLCTEETEGGIHTMHSQYDSSLRTKDLKMFEDSGAQPLLKSRGQQNLGHGMNMGDVANTICDREEGLLHFSFSQILVATDNLSERNLVGNGGFGHVYKGKLLNGLDIAVKRHDKSSSTQGQENFRREIEAIPNLRHENIIALLGCCVEGGETILVYEYMPNKNLASVIADETKRELLNWSKRLQIIEAIADGLAYLHGNSQMGIVHRDISPDNILLDQEMNAKISDFGMAIKLAPNAIKEVVVCGKYGYAAPEYLATGEISQKADVYSFGIIFLELISGKLSRAYIQQSNSKSPGLLLPDYARTYQKRLHKLIDPLLYVTKHVRAQITECVKLALLCTSNFENRPNMSEVVTMLRKIKGTQQ